MCVRGMASAAAVWWSKCACKGDLAEVLEQDVIQHVAIHHSRSSVVLTYAVSCPSLAYPCCAGDAAASRLCSWYAAAIHGAPHHT
jgi:hypothetical protein